MNSTTIGTTGTDTTAALLAEIDSEIEAVLPYTEAEVVTMTTNETTVVAGATAAATVGAKPKRSYPFESKAQILAKVEASDAFMVRCLGILYARQTEVEQDRKTTLNKNARGFMSSHAVNGSILAVKARGEGLSGEETDKARSIVVRYGKQLAEHFREERIEQDPSLASTAAIFGV